MQQYGTVNLGTSILEGKKRPNPANQELNLGKDVEIKKQSVYMGREKKDAIRRNLFDQKISFMNGRQKNIEKIR